MACLNVLVVESGSSVAAEVSRTLAALGHEVASVAQHLSDVATVLEHETPDVIVLGLDLSEGNEARGLATVLQATGPLPIVFVAEAIDWPERDQIRAVEGAALLLTPFGPAELRTALALAIDRTRAVKEGAVGLRTEEAKSR